MTWNNRLIRHTYTRKDGAVDVTYAVHEVFYNEAGAPDGLTQDPVGITGDTPSDLMGSLVMMIRDVWKSRHDILDYADFEPGGKYWSEADLEDFDEEETA